MTDILTDDERPKTEGIDELFRSAHTLKGLGSSVGLTGLSELGKEMEDILERIRSNKQKPDESIFGDLLARVDRLGDIIDDVEMTGWSEREISDLLDDNGSQDIEVHEKERGDGKNIRPTRSDVDSVSWRIRINDDCQLPSVRVFQITNGMDRSGIEILSSDPDSDSMDRIQSGEKIRIITRSAQKRRMWDLLSRIGEIEFEPEEDGSSGSEEKNIGSMKTVNVNIDRLDELMNLVGELTVEAGRSRRELEYGDPEKGRNYNLSMDRVIQEIRENVFSMRMTDLAPHFRRFSRMTRDLARKMGKDIRMETKGSDVELDRSVVDVIGEPLVHLLRNAVDHGIEEPEERKRKGKEVTGLIGITARKEKDRVTVSVSDDGGGLDLDSIRKRTETDDNRGGYSESSLINMIFEPGFSTRRDVTEISGRGVGMDAVRSSIESIGGNVSVYSEKDTGTRVEIDVPASIAMIGVITVGIGGRKFAVPVSSIEYLMDTRDGEMKGDDLLWGKREDIIILNTGKALGLDVEGSMAVVIKDPGGPYALRVDRIMDYLDVVTKPLGRSLASVKTVAGSTITEDGEVLLILDPLGIRREVEVE